MYWPQNVSGGDTHLLRSTANLGGGGGETPFFFTGANEFRTLRFVPVLICHARCRISREYRDTTTHILSIGPVFLFFVFYEM